MHTQSVRAMQRNIKIPNVGIIQFTPKYHSMELYVSSSAHVSYAFV